MIDLTKTIIKYLALSIFGASIFLNLVLFIKSSTYERQVVLIRQEYKTILEKNNLRCTKDLNEMVNACNYDYNVLKTKCQYEVNRLHKLYKSKI